MDEPSPSRDLRRYTARLFTNGGCQAVRLPKAYRFNADEVLIRRQGEAVILEPMPPGRRTPRTDAEWAAHWAALDALGGPDSPFPDPPPQTITPIKTW